MGLVDGDAVAVTDELFRLVKVVNQQREQARRDAPVEYVGTALPCTGNRGGEGVFGEVVVGDGESDGVHNSFSGWVGELVVCAPFCGVKTPISHFWANPCDTFRGQNLLFGGDSPLLIRKRGLKWDATVSGVPHSAMESMESYLGWLVNLYTRRFSSLQPSLQMVSRTR